jgi:hypothetical protein
MKLHLAFLGAALGLSLDGGVWAATAAPSDAKQPAPKPKARVYTNDDLDRIHPYAGQTGGGSTAATAADVESEAEAEPRARGAKTSGEAYWRAEAARVEERVRALEERAAALRARIAEETAKARERGRDVVYGRRRRASPPARSTAPLEASLAALERRIREVRDDLEERARRARALPGWLR